MISYRNVMENTNPFWVSEIKGMHLFNDAQVEIKKEKSCKKEIHCKKCVRTMLNLHKVVPKFTIYFSKKHSLYCDDML